MKTLTALFAILVLGLGTVCAAEDAAPDTETAAFDQLLQKVQTNPGGASEEDVAALLKDAQRLGRCYAVSLALKGYLAHNFQAPPDLLHAGAINAFRAGDFRAAAARLKGYLEAAKPGREASDAAALLCLVNIDLLGAEDDAYLFLTQKGDRFRASPAARKFDTWVIAQAARRQDFEHMAEALLRVFQDNLPLEEERLHYWDNLDWLMNEVRAARTVHYPALPALRKLVPLVRESRKRSARYSFIVANLGFGAGTAGKDEAALAKDFTEVAKAAKAYLDAFPTADTLKDVVGVLAGGGWSDDRWRQQQDAKRELFVYGFEKLPADERRVILDWDLTGERDRDLASPAQWAALGIKYPDLFAKADGTRRIAFHTGAEDKALIGKQAAFLKNVPSGSAAVINSLAAGGDDLKKAADHLLKQEGWHLNFTEAYALFSRSVWPAWRRLHTEGEKAPSDDVRREVEAYLGRAYLADSPAALFDYEGLEAYVEAAWATAGNGDKGRDEVIKDLKALAWVPLPDRERAQVYRDTYRSFRGWTENLRKEDRKKDVTVEKAVLDQIAPIEAAFKEVQSSGGDPSKAPNALCRHMAELVLAERRKDPEAYAKAAQALYPLIRNYPDGRTPFAAACFEYVYSSSRSVDTLPVQLAALEDLLKGYDAKGDNRRIRDLLSLIMQRRSWGWWRTTNNDIKKIEPLNALLADALLRELKQGRLPEDLWTWFRGTRVGDHWSRKDWGVEVYRTVIEKDLLEDHPWRPAGIRSAAVAYMDLVRHEAPGLAEAFPVETHFDDAFVAEAKRTGYLDARYWDYGRDEKKKVVNAAAEILAGYKTLPFGYNGETVVYDRAAFWDWQSRALGADPKPRDTMIQAIEATFGKTRFDTFAMGRARFHTTSSFKDAKDREGFFKQLDEYIGRQIDAPGRVSPPYLGAVASLEGKASLTDAELDVLLKLFPYGVPGTWPQGWHYEAVAPMVHASLVARGRATALYDVAPFLWSIARDTRSDACQQALAEAAAGLLEKDQNDLAYVVTSEGIDLAKSELSADIHSRLTATRSKAIAFFRYFIPAKPGEKEYPVYMAQAAYLTGRFQTAWETYLENRTLVQMMYKDLDPNFLIWLIEKHTELRQFEPAEALAREMIQWFDAVPEGFGAEIRGRLMLSYAHIALARKEFPRARALFERIAVDPEYEGTQARRDAELAVAEVDRLTNRHDEAIERLEKLSRAKDLYLQSQAFYHLALVKFDQGEFAECLDYLGQTLARLPDHSMAKILEARAKVKMNKLEEPTDVEIGPVTRQRFIVPGKTLKITLEDRNLSVVGPATDIQIRVWTQSGDEETFSLVPFGDTKTKFRGSITTELAPPKKDDDTLQLLGVDTVHYDYSEAFKKAHNITDSEVYTLAVRTDARLFVSSGKILSAEEREAIALERAIRSRLNIEEARAESVALSIVRPENQIKPGNKINARVEDLDRSESAERDRVKVRISASSGDSIAEFVLTETDTHSGVFEGAIPTAAGQARAYASGSEAGKDPNMVISAKEYAAWVGVPAAGAVQTFTIDLNDNVAPATMTLTAGVPGRKLKRFFLQTSLNGRDFTTVGAWPKAYEPWDGTPQLALVRLESARGRRFDMRSLTDLRDYLEAGYLGHGFKKVVRPTPEPQANWGKDMGGKARDVGLSASEHRYIAHFQGAFYQDRRQVRTFQLDHKNKTDGIEYILAVGGVPVSAQRSRRGEEAALPEIKRSLGKGVHVLEVFAIASRDADLEFTVLCDTPEPPYMVPCPTEMFDPAKNPQIAEEVALKPATIQAGDDAAAFTVAFPEGARARVVRLLLVDFESDAPAIEKIGLTDAAGEKLLPTEQDFMTLRENGVLEIVPGDRVTVVYEDPRVITRGKEHHEAFLTATYTNAAINACFVEFTQRGGERQARYVPMRRFDPGDKINVLINDPDMDVSEKQDTVSFTVRTSEGEPKELAALETTEHSGVFVGGVFPIQGEPQRDSEIKVVRGDDVILSYTDTENTDPGIPWTRTAIVEQVWFEPPTLRVYDVESRPLTDEELAAEGNRAEDEAGEFEEHVPITHTLIATWPETPHTDKPASCRITVPVPVEVIFPAVAKSPESTVELFVQTSSGREAMGVAPDGDFNVNVPGTLRLTARPSNLGSLTPPPGYKGVLVRTNPYALDAIDDGRFTFLVPLELGKLPADSLALEDEMVERPDEKPTLKIKGDDTVFLGFRYTDPDGEVHWLTRQAKLGADAFFNVMDRRYRDTVEGIYVGETLYFRLIDPTRDVSDEKDPVAVLVTTSSGTEKRVELMETFSHSGVFKGLANIVYKGEQEQTDDPFALPVTYGDDVTARYDRETEGPAMTRLVSVFKGSDGDVLPFTKRFKDPTIAMQTQFTIAEAYFELAKRHRDLEQDSLARREIQQGKKLLEEAIRDFPETEARAQADYLLANLALEFANDAVNEEMKRGHYTEAINRFSDIVATYPDSVYAPKAQYKKALTFEKMGEIDQACEEYVKLSYRYPDNELVAETIARLGQYFLTKGKEFKARIEAETDAVESEKIAMQSREMFTVAAQVFRRLAVRFPKHRLADKTTVLSAQCYMQAEDYEAAVKTFRDVMENPEADKDLVAEAMYWCGDSYMRMEGDSEALRNAYIVFKKLTWDYPATKWAKFARGRLTDERLAKIEID